VAASVVGAPRHPSTVEAAPTGAPAVPAPGLARPGIAFPKAAGDNVATVTFSEGCGSSGVGVGIAFDGANLWFTCQVQSPDLFRADPLTGMVDASYTIVGGLGALVYDCTDNSILAGWGGGDPGGTVRKITLDANQNVTGSSVLFDAGVHPVSCGLLDGIALDVTTVPKTVYLSDDCSTIVHRYLYDGTHVEAVDDSPWTGPDCYNSGLALGGDDLYQGSDGCGHVYVHSKTPWPMVGPNNFDFSTVVANDPGFRDEGLACDDASFPVDVMWSMEAYEPRRANAFEIPAGSCLTCAAPPPDPCECVLGQPPDEDEAPPVISGVPPDAVVSCDDVPPAAAASASDACDPAPVLSFAEAEVPGACPPERVITRTWTARDACGNESVAVQVITVVDDVAPALVGVPADVEVRCEPVPDPASPSAVDACDPAPALVYREVRIDGNCPAEYVLERTWEAEDACGNVVSATQRVNVHEGAPLVLEAPPDVEVECSQVPPAPELVAISACDPAPPVAFVEQRLDGDCPNAYQLVRTWTAIDSCGRSAVARQVVSVVDRTPPRIGGLTRACLWPPNHWMVCLTPADFPVDVADDCPGTVTVRFTGCRSDQPEDGRGDGDFLPDCIVGEDGSVCARAERQGTVPAGRHYGVLAVAIDACGNESEEALVGDIYVPHDQSPHEDCLNPTKVGIKNGPHTSQR
jgi:hypothetical protein